MDTNTNFSDFLRVMVGGSAHACAPLKRFIERANCLSAIWSQLISDMASEVSSIVYPIISPLEGEDGDAADTQQRFEAELGGNVYFKGACIDGQSEASVGGLAGCLTGQGLFHCRKIS